MKDGIFYLRAFPKPLKGELMPIKLKKLTLQVPNDLLARATQATGEGITPTIRRGLELVAAGGAYRNLRSLKGQVKLDLDLEKLRQDQ